MTTPEERERALRAAVNEVADQLCAAVDGRFDFTVRASVDDETVEKLSMLVNFVLDTTRRGLSDLAARNESLAMERLRSDFMANVSHELRTPLALVLGPLDAMLDGEQGALPAPALESLRRVRRNAGRLLSLVDDLLDLARNEAGRLETHPVRIDLKEELAALCDDATSAAEARGVRLSFQTDLAEAPCSTDPRWFDKIVLNLLANALKFTPEGGSVTVELRAAITTEGRGYELRVKDTGLGIPEGRLHLLFKRFQQVDTSRTRQFGGTGLGLALVKEFTELLGGTVQAESVQGRGSTFTVRIPRGEISLVEDPVPGALARARGVAGGALERLDPVESRKKPKAVPATAAGAGLDASSRPGYDWGAERPRVLLAEDNADMRAFARAVLEKEFEVLTATDGAEALELAEKHRPDAIVSDVMMPSLDGLGLLERVRASEALKHTAVILLTARAGSEAAEEGLDAGADDYVRKPFSPGELRARVRAQLRIRRAEAELALTCDELAHSRAMVATLEGQRARAETIERVREAMNASLEALPRGERTPGVDAAFAQVGAKMDELRRESERALAALDGE